MSPSDHAQSDPHAAAAAADHLAHHFASPEQQSAAGRLGMWIFLVSEILLFGGLFCAYTVYRANHPEIFLYGERFLDRNLGALNTCILITSSLTMAWAVRCAQRSGQRGLVLLLGLTLVLACGFLGVKYVEYEHKWRDGLLWASRYQPTEHAVETAGMPAHDLPAKDQEQACRNAGIFFSIYFLMTGLHGVHVLAGMGAITWVLVRAARGAFSSRYFGPVDYVGLYWHLVDMIWIYLFPLLYLIH